MADTSNYDMLLQGGTVMTAMGRQEIDVGVKDGCIAGLGDLTSAEADQRIDCKGLHVLPGVIDSQVHFREPGATHKEDLESGSKGAAAGGVTAYFEMPNTNPLTITQEAIDEKLSLAKGRSWSDHAFYVGGSAANITTLAELEKSKGICGVKIFMGASTGDLLSPDDPTIREILKAGSRLVAVHAEDNDRLQERASIAQEAKDCSAHPIWRDVETCLRATKRVVTLAQETGRRVHVLHITTGEEMAYLAAVKKYATVEVTPQHLTLDSEAYHRIGAKAQQNPPVRERAQVEALWRAVQAGVVDVIGTDHAPHTLEEKSKPYPQSPSGMTGVQTLVPVMLNHVNEGRLTLERFVDLTSAGPQRVFNIAGKGRIALGYDADFTLVDLKAKRTITDEWIHSRAGWTPFHGMSVQGWPIATIIRGNTVMREDELLGTPIGEPVSFRETLA